MDTRQIFELVKAGKARRLMNNCYSAEVIERADGLWRDGDGFVFSHEDHGVRRLVFFAEGADAADALLARVDPGRYTLEFMTKDRDEYVPRGTGLRAAMMRLANADCRGVLDADSPVMRYRGAAAVEEATADDAPALNAILWSTFDTAVSHLLDDDELRAAIGKGQLSLHRDGEGRIDALLQADVMPKRFYINQIVNQAQRHVIHAMLLDRLEKYVSAGGRYLYAWVAEGNVASLKFHGKYGMKHDGMWNMVYTVER